MKKKSLRDGFGKAIVQLAEKHQQVVALSADLISSTRLTSFQEKYPQRVFQIGVAEQNMAGIAAGLAIKGFLPFICSFAVFCPGRCLDQIRVQIALNKLKVVIVGSHAGLSHPKDGPTAQATEDIALMRSMPNIDIVYPADYNQMLKAVEKIYQHPKSVYLRMTREPTQVFTDKDTEFEIGKGQIIRKGKDVSIISSGPLICEVVKAVDELEKQNLDVEVINIDTIKPLDKQIILQTAGKTGKILTVEDHQKNGGLGEAVASVVAEESGAKVKIMAIDNQFGTTARDYQTLLTKYHLDAEGIRKRVENYCRIN